MEEFRSMGTSICVQENSSSLFLLKCRYRITAMMFGMSSFFYLRSRFNMRPRRHTATPIDAATPTITAPTEARVVGTVFPNDVTEQLV